MLWKHGDPSNLLTKIYEFCNFCFVKCVITINIHINLCNSTLSISLLCVCNAKSYLHYFHCLLYIYKNLLFFTLI